MQPPKPSTRTENMHRQVLFSLLFIGLVLGGLYTGRNEFLGPDGSDNDYLYLGLLLLAILAAFAFLGFTLRGKDYKNFPLLVLLNLGLLVLFFYTPRLATKYGIGPTSELGYDAYEGALIRAESRYHGGDWESAIDIYRLLEEHMRPQDHQNVLRMTSLLHQAGYFPKPTTKPTDAVIDALKQLQEDFGLPATGSIDHGSTPSRLRKNTQTVLYGLAYKQKLGLSPTQKPTFDELIAAIKKFQEKNGVGADGDIGEETLSKITK